VKRMAARRRFKKLTIDLPVEVQKSPHGTFTEGDVRINKKGVTISGTPSSSRPALQDKSLSESPSITEFDEIEDTGEILGSGGSAMVRKGVHRPTNTTVALKIIAVDTNSSTRMMIMKELKVLYECSHPCIVTFYGAFYQELAVYIALEYMDGGTLLDLLEAVGTVEERYLRKIGKQVLDGLYYIHKRLHTIHRDLKPGNLLVNRQGQVKIADFGVSGKMQNTYGIMRTFVGTVTYMSPERIEGSEHSSTSDMWSYGLTLLELAIGHYPYQKKNEDGSLSDKPFVFFELLSMIKDSSVPSLPEGSSYSDSFKDLLAICLKKDPQERCTSESLLDHKWIQDAIVDKETCLRDYLVEQFARLKERKQKSKPAEANDDSKTSSIGSDIGSLCPPMSTNGASPCFLFFSHLPSQYFF